MDSTGEFVDEFAKEGLRTLYLAKKTIGENEYKNWNKEFEKAMLST